MGVLGASRYDLDEARRARIRRRVLSALDPRTVGSAGEPRTAGSGAADVAYALVIAGTAPGALLALAAEALAAAARHVLPGLAHAPHAKP